MSRSTKRSLEDIPNLDEDPDDETYGAPSKRVKRSSHPASAPKMRKKGKKSRRHRGSDIVSDDDDDISDSDESLSIDSDFDTSPIETTETGRPRRATVRETKYEEPESEVDSNDDDDDQNDNQRNRSGREETPSRQPKPEPEPSLIIKLNVPSLRRRGSQASRATTGGKSVGGKHPSSAMQRRSSRLSGSEEQPLVSLTGSGRHEQVERVGSAEPEFTGRRAIRAGKSLPTTSAIMEVSQEGSAVSKIEQDELGDAVFYEEAVEDSVGEDQEETNIELLRPEVSQISGYPGTEDEDDGPVRPSRRRSARNIDQEVPEPASRPRSTRRNADEESDFEPPPEEGEDEGDSSHSDGSKSHRKDSQRSEASSRRSGRIAAAAAKRKRDEEDSDAIDDDELREEAADLAASTREKRRKRKRSLEGIVYDAPRRRTRGNQLDYTIRPEMWATGEDDDQLVQTTSTSRRAGAGGTTYRSLWNTSGPFGLAGGPPPVLRRDGVAAGRADSDSSDDEMQPKPARGIGGAVGMTPTSAMAPSLFPQSLNADPAQQSTSGGPANFGKIKDRKALADADPLGVDPNVNFDGVGGLDSHINQLKEMVLIPLLYPEIFQRFHVTPPRGVLFHGPPGTGKTLLARALASSVSSEGKKVTFYMRKGADALSKWVGEAEKQLRMLFEEARKNQPSIIFFDEIDGLAPVRSSKQDQIHASIVATLLALMDGMDGRGQVIVIGATNRPDTVDPALRRPGRFDREFYFPLPNETARRSIIDIHTQGWNPPLETNFKTQLASITKGYGGADLRALCTEAALNAVQGTYPQIYQSDKKLVIDPSAIKVLAKDFMISVNKMIPSSERATTSNAAPLDSSTEPLLRKAFSKISTLVDDILPEQKQISALEEAEYGDRDESAGFDREIVQQNFDRARVFRPRLLIYGMQGLGQQYLGQALLNKFERLHVQSFDLSVLYSDTTRSPEAAVVQLFTEARRHKPSVIYIPNVQLWYDTVGEAVLRLFTGLLRSLPPNEPVLLLGIMELEHENTKPHPNLLKDLFGFSKQSHFVLNRPDELERREFFQQLISLINSSPTTFPDQSNRQKREIPKLPVAIAPETPKKQASREELKAQKKNDRNTLNMLKIRLAPIMEQLKRAYKGFRKPPIDPGHIQYLYDEQNPEMVNTDLPLEQRQQETYRPYELDTDDKGVPGIREVVTQKFYYNLELITIERRLSNGFYKRYKDFVADIKRLNRDAKVHGDADRILKANEMLANVEVDTNMLFEMQDPVLVAECENVYEREQERARQQAEEDRRARELGQDVPTINPNVPVHVSGTTAETSGPIVLGQQVPGPPPLPRVQSRPTEASPSTSLSNGYSVPSDLERAHSTWSKEVQDGDQDVEMSNTNEEREDSRGEGLESSANTQTQKSQKSALTAMAQNSQAAEYHNSASTTSSGQKTSDKSRSSGQNTQTTNGVVKDYPDFAATQPASGGSDLPDTQEMNYSNSNSQPHSSPQASQPSQPASQKQQDRQSMPPPTPHADATAPTGATSIASLLNNPSEGRGATTAAQSERQLSMPLNHIIDLPILEKLHEELTKRSSGFTVEQLEQMNAALMDTVWKRRGEWNRNLVVHECQNTYNRVVKDIEEMQRILPNSQSSNEDAIGVEAR